MPAAAPVAISSADSARLAEGAKVAAGKRCNGCQRVLDLELFPWRSREKNYRGPRCLDCDAAHQRAAYHERKARAAAAV